MAETTTERRRPSTVVTSQNLAEYQAKEMDRLAPIATTPIKEMMKEPEKETPKEESKVEAKTETSDESKKTEVKTEDESKAKEEAKKSKEPETEKQAKENTKFSERMHELAEKAKAERIRREELERKVSELEAKLKPEPVREKIEESPKPTKEQYPDPHEYAEKLSDWKVQDALRKRDEDDAKARKEAEESAIKDSWLQRVNDIKKEIPDYQDKIASSNIVVSDEIRDAIYQSEIGPKILLHLSEHPDEADKIGKMTVGKALIAFGKLEAKLSTPVKEEKEELEPEKPKEKLKPVEVSKAPAPITPLKGATASADLPIINGEWKGTHEQFREARKAGKLK